MLKINKNYLREHFHLYFNIRFIALLFISYITYKISINIQSYAGILATHNASNSVTDTLFRILPIYNTKIIHDNLTFYYSNIREAIFFLFPQRALFGFASLSLLMIIRAFFLNLTNLGIPEGSNPIENASTFGGDLFFSGHTAYPFLLALIFWDIKILRYTFFIISLILGFSSILGRYHYSIDVFAAPFIAYGVFKISQKLFPEKYEDK